MKKLHLSFLLLAMIQPNAIASELEGSVIKFRALFDTMNSRQKGLPEPYTDFYAKTPQKKDRLFSVGVGAEAAFDVFWTDNIAAEFVSGFRLLRERASTVNNIASNYNTAPEKRKRKDAYIIPSSAALQYHIAPYGAIRPYIGGGYHYTYMLERTNSYRIQNASGPLIQAGVDFVFKDDSYVNFDVKQYMLRTKVKYSTSFVTDKDGKHINTNMKLDPVSIGVGMGFRF
ncbi:MAG: OmpW family outer membrane protein [Rickettsiaceae bacterium]|nr:OmpW family outer membrane protein [Rickettsiaceae bacterium]